MKRKPLEHRILHFGILVTVLLLFTELSFDAVLLGGVLLYYVQRDME